MQSLVILIPAYQPGAALVEVVGALAARSPHAIVVVDDGSGGEFRAIFDQVLTLPNTTVLRHAVNMGKGAALKTGINFILCEFPGAAGVVTLDADGQHHPDDVLSVCSRFEESPDQVVIGARSFQGEIPLRSWLGNQVTRIVLRLVLGQRLTDTQTGLRAIPKALLPQLLKIGASGYEFELEMLVTAKHSGLGVIEQPIRTIYEHGNPTSHFNPLRDSMRIYFVLLRFSLIAVLTAVLDNLLFYMVFGLTGSIIRAQVCARLVAAAFNYSVVRGAAFRSDERHGVVLPRYLLLVAVNAVLSYTAIRLLTGPMALHVFPAKILTETFLFVANFAIQRDFVFTRRGRSQVATNWDRYYQAVPATAKLTRLYTQNVLISALKRFGGRPDGADTIVEIGGANSCFMDGIFREVHPGSYHVVDQNEFGLSLLERRLGWGSKVTLHQGDVLQLPKMDVKADVVFSVGLVEHFDTEGTRKAIAAHFNLLRAGGCAIISFPTATWLYSAARTIFETLGLWRFPDERPLARDEVARALQGCGEIIFEKTLWPLILTQHLMVVRKA
jgi:glycosyltransferase involved in cell wall biosynthesis